MISITLTDTDAQAYLDKEEVVSLSKFNRVLKQYNTLEIKYTNLERENQELRNKLKGMETLLKTKATAISKTTFNTSTVSSTSNIKAREARELQPVESPLKRGIEALQAEKQLTKPIGWKSKHPQAERDRALVQYAYDSKNKSERKLELLHRKMPHRSVRSIMDYCYRTYPGIKFKDGYMIR